MSRLSSPSTNGKTSTSKSSTSTNGKTRPRSKSRPVTQGQQRIAYAVGGVGCFVLMLSVWECCAALQTLTGMPMPLAGLLAVGIDLGMVVSEAAAIAAHQGSEGQGWAEWYVYLAVGLSVVLNAAAAASHASGWLVVIAIPVGACVPLLVYITGRVAGGLYTGR